MTPDIVYLAAIAVVLLLWLIHSLCQNAKHARGVTSLLEGFLKALNSHAIAQCVLRAWLEYYCEQSMPGSYIRHTIATALEAKQFPPTTKPEGLKPHDAPVGVPKADGHAPQAR